MSLTRHTSFRSGPSSRKLPISRSLLTVNPYGRCRLCPLPPRPVEAKAPDEAACRARRALGVTSLPHLAVGPVVHQGGEPAFDNVRQAARGMPAVIIRMLHALAIVMDQTITPEQRLILLRQADMIIEAAPEPVPDSNDLGDIEARYGRLVEMAPALVRHSARRRRRQASCARRARPRSVGRR